jgi:GT2 family glycosyltransferase
VNEKFGLKTEGDSLVEVTIAVVPRDRFSKSAITIRSLIAYTPKPFRLVIVDAGTPVRYRKAMERAAEGHDDVQFLRTHECLNSNAAKNFVLREIADTEYLAFVENDNEVHEGWLEALINACEEEGAAVARPLIMERKILRTFPHFDQRFNKIEKTAEGNFGRHRILPRKRPLSSDVGSAREMTTVLETHVVLFKRWVFDRIGPFDEEINTRQEVDLALALFDADIPIVFEPKSVVKYYRPPPVNRDERDYFFDRWNPKNAVRSHEIIEERWGVVNLPPAIQFAKHRSAFATYPTYAGYYFRHEFVPYLRWELWPNFKYFVYKKAEHFPVPVKNQIQRALYR